jgi:hypothetical protein
VEEADAAYLVEMIQEHLLLGPRFLAGAFHRDATVGRAGHIDRGVSDLSALGSSACARRAISPKRALLSSQFPSTSVFQWT